MDLGNDGLPDAIASKDFSNVIVKLDGKQVYLCEFADRKAGTVQVFVTDDPAVDNFNSAAVPLVPLVNDELQGHVTFHVQ